jgi:hypothetical protein
MMKFKPIRRPHRGFEIQPEPTRAVFTPTCYPSVAAALWSDWWVVGDDLRLVYDNSKLDVVEQGGKHAR